MVRVCRVVPKEWTRYSPLGTVIPRTRFIVFKTPLNDRLLTKVDRTQRFTVWNLMWMLAERGLRLGLVVDLTDTDRYYDKDEIEGLCIQYQKISCPGRGFVERTECVSEFNKAIQDYIDKTDDEEALIGVHCTNGVNRSGYLICRFLIERLGWSSHEALDAFERARGYPIEKGSYVQALHKAAIDARNKRDLSDSDSEDHRRKSKKSKRKREKDEAASFSDSASQMGNIMQQFFAQLQGAHQAAESGNGSGYDGSPAQSGSYASPAQQHWAYQSKPQTHVKNASYTDSPVDQTVQDEEMEEGEDMEGTEEMEHGAEQPQVKSTAQKRRDRRQRMKNMLSVMKRGRFHEIQEMQPSMGINVMPFDLQQQRKQYRAPFKIHFVQWNPCSDLLALASRKGEVMVKRNAWKRCWKVNVSELTAFPEPQCSKPASVESITWSPDGAMLAVAMSDGHLHLIEAEEGIVRWSRSLGPSSCAQRMRWFWSGSPPPVKMEWIKDWPMYDEVKAAASIFGNADDILDERISKTLLYENLYRKSLKGTILFMIRDDLVVLALAGGLVPVTEIRLVEKIAHLKLDVISIYDVLYSQKDGLTIAVTDYGPRPKLDDMDRDSVCKRTSARLSGENVADPLKGEDFSAEKRFGVPVFVPEAVNCPHTHLINIDFKLENEKLLWELLLRFLKMYHCLLHFTYSVEMSKKDWESESKIFANRLNSSARDLHIGVSLLNSLLGGTPGPLADRWLERTLGVVGIHSMQEFVDKRFSGLVAFLRGQVSASARSLAFQMDQFRELVKEMQEEATDYETITLSQDGNASVNLALGKQLTSSVLIPDVSADCVFDAVDAATCKAILDRLHDDGIKVQVKCEEMTLAATSNLRELSQLVRWMSLLTPLLKNSKRPAQVIEQNRKWDVAQLLEYLVGTFVTELGERECLTKSLFKIEEILKEMRAEETKENFDEDELMRDVAEECSPIKERDDRSLGELLAAGRKGNTPVLDSPMCGISETSTSHSSQSARPVHSEYVLDKVHTFWREGLDKATLDLLGERFALDGVREVINSTTKSLQTVVKEVIHLVQASSLLAVQNNTNMNVKWMYELASDASHCGFDSVGLSTFRWSDPKDHDAYERRLFNAKEKNMEGAICVSTVSRDGLTCEYLLPHACGKLKAGIQQEISLAVVMQPGGFVETTPVQSEMAQRMDQSPDDGLLQLVTDENVIFGNIVKFLSVDMFAGGYAYTLATFKSEGGEINRLMRKHPAIDIWFVHSGLLSEISESVMLSTDRKQGCIISEEGTRIALFRVQNTSSEEQQSTLLTEAPSHRPALQLLPHHHMR
ncbi:hypothetical protein RB195_012477 [Necator americanus]